MTGARRVVLLIVVGLIAAVVIPMLAGASHSPVVDGNDVAGLLDVREVSVVGTREPRWLVATYPEWTTQRIWDRGIVLIRIDARRGSRFDYYVLVRSTGSGMQASLWRDRVDRSDFRVSFLNAYRPNRRSVRVRLPLGKLNFGANRLFYNWKVETLFSSNACPRVCFDFAPNFNAPPVQEPIPGRSPDPTITVTPTPALTETPTP